MTPSNQKKEEFIVMSKSTGRVVREGTARIGDINSPWHWMGITAPDIIKTIFYGCIAVVFCTKFWMENESMKTFISEQTAINTHLELCNDNRDKWSSLKNGHLFSCGMPTDGWVPTVNNFSK